MKPVVLFFASCLAACASAETVKPHPRLFADAARMEEVRTFCATNELGRAVRDRILSVADSVLPKPVLTRQLDGRRMLNVSRVAQQRLFNLGLAWRFTRDRRYLERVARELDAVCAFTDWNPQHYLDVGEMAFAVAVAYDWVYDGLTAEERTRFAAGLARHAFGPLFEDREMNWGDLKTTWWLKADNNWNSVCAGGTLAAGWALWDDPAAAARAQEAFRLCREALPLGMKCYAPSGSYPEGPSYWGFGTTYCCVGAEMIREATGDDSDVVSAPGFVETVYYPDRVTGPSGNYFNFGDNRAERHLEFASFYLAHRFGKTDALSRFCLDALRRECALRDEPTETGVEERRLYPLIVLYLDRPVPPDAAPANAFWYSGANAMPVVTAGPVNGAWFAAKGGRAKASHMHMDVGGFVYEANGERLVFDFGWENYPNAEAHGIDIWDNAVGGKRWRCFRLGPKSHAVALVGDELPYAQGFAPFTAFETNSLPCSVTLDLTEVYPAAKHATRVFTLAADGTLTVTDRFEGLAEGTPVSVRFPVLRGAKVALECPDAVRETVAAETLLEDWAMPIEPSDLVVFSKRADSAGAVEFATSVRPTPVR